MTRVGRGVSFEMKGWASPTKTEPSVTPPQDSHRGPWHSETWGWTFSTWPHHYCLLSGETRSGTKGISHRTDVSNTEGAHG